MIISSRLRGSLRGRPIINREHFWLSEEQFGLLEPHLRTDSRGRPRIDVRRAISGIIHVVKSGGR
ncbi:hypothetical protein BQ8482_570009 [Mesorhizobium delmotii]|uniref:Transposase n=1 Tax=Mesorhizobium delmotii TaxID=1631247 RepID=A0A2P9AV30_9HYPH|nr:hypothetical protein BQ8482_570009 [Mesorhizobium delmotii]